MDYLDELVVTERLLVNRVNPILLDELLDEPPLVDLAGHGGHDRHLGHLGEQGHGHSRAGTELPDFPISHFRSRQE